MTLKSCKYGCNTLIQWDTQINAFKEEDGTLHNRARCESLRPLGAVGTSPQNVARVQQAQQQQQVQPHGPTRYESSYLIPKEDWDKLIERLTIMTTQLERLSTFYDGMMNDIESLRKMAFEQQQYQKHQQHLAEAEEQYDHDKESGFV